MGVKRIYEVQAFDNVKDESKPNLAARETSTKKVDILKIGLEWSKRFFRVEVGLLTVHDDDESTIEGDELIAAWEDGKKTTK